MASAAREYRLPLSAVGTIADPGLQFHLYSIGFSHYNERARWLLRLAGIAYTRHNVLPLFHIPTITALYNNFPAERRGSANGGRKTETPALAVYDAAGKPVCLIQDGALIGRYCVLRAQALSTPCPPLYGQPLELQSDGLVMGQGQAYEEIEALEARLSGKLGWEVRRIVYWYILHKGSVMVPLLRNNAPNRLQALLAPLLWLVMRLLLPKAFKINKGTAASGKDKLRGEFEFVGGVLKANGANSSANSSKGSGALASSAKLQYLVGDTLSAADVTFAAVSSPMLWVGQADGFGGWLPPMDGLSKEGRSFVGELRAMPAGAHVLRLFEQYAKPQALQAS